MRQAMIFAAGLGTRLKPLTDTMPKALVRVGGQPLLLHVVMKLKAAGFERIVVNVHHFAQQIVDYLEEHDRFGLDIRISDETGGLLETGGGIRKALPLFSPAWPVLIHNVDILSNIDLDACMKAVECPGAPDALLVVSQRITKRYLLFDNRNVLDGWTNIETGEVKGAGSEVMAVGERRAAWVAAHRQLAFSGIHVLSPSVFPLFGEMPERFGIIDFYLKHCHHCTFLGSEQKGLRLLDVGKLDTLEKAEAFL